MNSLSAAILLFWYIDEDFGIIIHKTSCRQTAFVEIAGGCRDTRKRPHFAHGIQQMLSNIAAALPRTFSTYPFIISFLTTLKTVNLRGGMGMENLAGVVTACCFRTENVAIY